MNSETPNPTAAQPPAIPAPPAPTPRPASAGGANVNADADVNAKEEVLWVGRTSWKHFIGTLSLWLLGSILWGSVMGWLLSGKTFNTFLWAGIVPIVVVGAFLLVRVLWVVLSSRYQITNQRIFYYRGILSQTIDQTELIRVDDVRVFKSVIDRVMGLGNVEMLSTDVTDKDTKLIGIADPDRVAETIRSNMKRLRKRAMFVEGL